MVHNRSLDYEVNGSFEIIISSFTKKRRESIIIIAVKKAKQVSSGKKMSPNSLGRYISATSMT